MVAAELGRGLTKGELPLGNAWKLSIGKISSMRGGGEREIEKLDESSEAIQRLVIGVQENFINEGWDFASVVGNNGGLAIVFTNPLRLITARQCPPPDFLKPEALKALAEPTVEGWNLWRLPIRSINDFLKGTNLYAYNARGAYNELELEKRSRWPVRKSTELKYYQSGVAYVAINLHSILSETSIIEDGEYWAKERFQKEMKELSIRRAKISALQTSSPEKFF